MTRKDFELIAEVFRSNGNLLTEDQQYLWDAMVYETCLLLAGTNPQFNGETFRKACKHD